MNTSRLRQLAEAHRTGLLHDVVPFWQKHAVDREHGGFFTCLDRDGSVYATDKPVWIMGRATWLFATLFSEVEPRSEWLDLAWHGYNFLTRHCFDASGKMYFLVTREGRPLRTRRYYFSEVFAVLAFAALARATGDATIRARAVDLFDRLVCAWRTPGVIPPKVEPGTPPTKSLSPLMCLINVADTMLLVDRDPRYEQIIDEAVNEILCDFADRDRRCVFETVGPTGEKLDTLEGRVLNPGHAIECAWFILEIARRRGDRGLVAPATDILRWSFDRGWDPQFGGLLSFVDVAGRPSPYLEHDMKMWWPHSEALYATLLAWRMTGDAAFAEMYEKVHEWTLGHFPDPDHGEWFGYLRRDGAVSSTLKGNLWKGPFHIPRAQLLCWKLLDSAV